MSKKSDLLSRIKRRLGYPMVKVELDDTQINDSIEFARTKYIKYAAGNATQEVFFTMMLSAGNTLYDLPGGVTEVISYDSNAMNTGGINTLFTMDNWLYTQGMFGLLEPNASNTGYSLIGYHIAIDFLETLERYTPDSYRFRYQRTTNQLEIQPPPPSGNTFLVGDYSYDSPGFILIRAMMIDGASMDPDNFDLDSTDNDLYDAQWVEDYATARSKLVLGMVRRKFAGFTALGNQGTVLDGGDLVSEAKEEIEKLEEKLQNTEPYIGFGVSWG